MRRFDMFDLALILSGLLVPVVFAEMQLGLISITVVEIAVLLMLAGFAARVKREQLKLKLSTADKIFLTLIAWTAFSLFRSIDPAKTLREFLWLVESGLVFYMVEHGIRDREEINRLLRAWCYGAVIVSSIGLLHYFSSLAAGEGPVRIFSTLLNANSLAGYLILFLPIMIALQYGKKLDQRCYWLVLATVASTALAATYTRGGWYAAIAAIALMAGLLRDRRLASMLVVYILVYSFAMPNFAAHAATGLEPGKETNVNARVQLWQVGIKMWQENPLAGVGVGNYLLLHDEYLERYPQVDRGYLALEPHNSFIKFLAETGMVGLALFLALLGTVAKQLLSQWHLFQGKSIYPLLVGITCGIVAFLLQSNTNSLFHAPRVAFGIWIVIGMLLTYMIAERKASQSSSSPTLASVN